MELLDQQQITSGLPAAVSAQLRSFTVLGVVDSTNRFLLEGDFFGAAGVHACVAETQTAGRGRRGRPWVSPSGANLYLSVLRTFSSVPDSLQGLSLAVGVAVAKALASLDVQGIALKWPNDIQLGGKKLGGILVEMSGGSRGPWRVVAGIGINIDMPRDAGANIDQPWADLASHGAHPGRNRLASRVLAEVVMAEEQFIAAGFAAFHRDWELLDALRDREVELHAGSGRRCGTARGVDASGALLLEVEGRCERVVSGDIRLRVVT
ncbi:MAG: bifunctional biotin--[acetyl-CoA-carboxylase] ligase/biotin operon repressor BirA [Gammaproteobacteria bacterium]|nr:MAG: bifunctional biotin--[acetyl-CoA-carboxylase] ligase/biotin operon repressor BirA [Gammaproteobacteria bacterium]